jgi:hypothetical protein
MGSVDGLATLIRAGRCWWLSLGCPAGDLDPRVESQLLEDLGDVVACGALGDREFLGDLAVG